MQTFSLRQLVNGPNGNNISGAQQCIQQVDEDCRLVSQNYIFIKLFPEKEQINNLTILTHLRNGISTLSVCLGSTPSIWLSTEHCERRQSGKKAKQHISMHKSAHTTTNGWTADWIVKMNCVSTKCSEQEVETTTNSCVCVWRITKKHGDERPNSQLMVLNSQTPTRMLTNSTEVYKFSRHLFRFASVARETETEKLAAYKLHMPSPSLWPLEFIYCMHCYRKTSIYLIAESVGPSVRQAHTSPIWIQLKLYDLETEKFEMEKSRKLFARQFQFTLLHVVRFIPLAIFLQQSATESTKHIQTQDNTRCTNVEWKIFKKANKLSSGFPHNHLVNGILWAQKLKLSVARAGEAEGARINRNKLFFGTFEFCFKWLFFVDDVLDAEIAGTNGIEFTWRWCNREECKTKILGFHDSQRLPA